jgi:hypothetical protein
MEKLMTEESEAPVEGAKVAKVARAKPQIEIEAERKAAEAALARAQTVGRARPLIETDSARTQGDPSRMVECRVLNKGEGRIQTGANPPEFFAAGATFEVSETSAIQLEARGYAERTRA